MTWLRYEGLGRGALGGGAQAGVERVLGRGLAAGDIGCGRWSEAGARALLLLELGGQALTAGRLSLGAFSSLLGLVLLVVRSAAAIFVQELLCGIVLCSDLEFLYDLCSFLGRFLQSCLDVLNAVVVPGVQQPADADDGYGTAGYSGVLDRSPSVDAGDQCEDGGDEDVRKGRVESPEGPEPALS